MALSADRTPFGDLRCTTSTIMSEFTRSKWNSKRRSRTLRIRVQCQTKSHWYDINLCPSEQMYSCGKAICHASPSRHFFTLARRCNMASAGGHNRSLVFKVKSFFPRRVKSAMGGKGGCDNDGSTNEGDTERAWNVRATDGSTG
jgi:hypothetical protein